MVYQWPILVLGSSYLLQHTAFGLVLALLSEQTRKVFSRNCVQRWLSMPTKVAGMKRKHNPAKQQYSRDCGGLIKARSL